MAVDPKGVYYIEDVIRGQWSAGKREQVIKQTAEIDGPIVRVYHEQEPGSGGKESAENTTRNLAGYTARADKVTGDKVTRAEPFAAQCEGHNVKIKKADWNRSYLERLTAFPNATYKDDIDASSGAFNKLAGVRPAQIVNYANQQKQKRVRGYAGRSEY
jgi:predicted phage terminase large subunit-like protein